MLQDAPTIASDQRLERPEVGPAEPTGVQCGIEYSDHDVLGLAVDYLGERVEQSNGTALPVDRRVQI